LLVSEIEAVTIQRRHLITLGDVIAFEMACPACKTAVRILIKECYRIAHKCPQCSKAFFFSGAAENEAILELAKAIEDIKAQCGPKTFEFRIEIDAGSCEVGNDGKSKA